MSSVSRVLLVFIFWRIRQSEELCEVVLWNEHQGVLVFVWVWDFEPEEVESGLKDWSWMVERQRGWCRGGTEEYDL
jgi:hypothetical protein